ncbi:hypothetical protein YC2023_056120 [Brassica napus]
MISGAKYSCVPTKDMDLVLGSATSSGREPECDLETSVCVLLRVLLFFLLLFEKMLRGEKHDVVGSIMQEGWTQKAPRLDGSESNVLIRVGETAHLRERSKSDSIM